MAEIQTSFIPKKSLGSSGGPAKAGAKPVGILMLLSILIFLTAALVHGGAFVYEKQLQSSIEGKRVELKEKEEIIKPGLLEDIDRLSTKIDILQGPPGTTEGGLLGRHISLIPLLNYLERTTLPSVRYKTFRLTARPGGMADLKMTGLAQDYSSVALQSGEYTRLDRPQYFKDIVFTDLNLDQLGQVTFNFTASVDPFLLSYHEAVKFANQTNL